MSKYLIENIEDAMNMLKEVKKSDKTFIDIVSNGRMTGSIFVEKIHIEDNLEDNSFCFIFIDDTFKTSQLRKYENTDIRIKIVHENQSEDVYVCSDFTVRFLEVENGNNIIYFIKSKE